MSLQTKIREIRESLFVAAPVIVKEVKDYKRQRVDVQLKTKITEDLEPPKILDVPVSHEESTTFSERQLPEKDDVAWVVFTNRSLDKVLEDSELKKPDYDRVLDINDCFLVGEWSTEKDGIPKELGSMKKDDWLIGLHRDKESRIYLRRDGNIVLHPGKQSKIEIVEDADDYIPLFKEVAKKFNDHKHNESIGSETSPPQGQYQWDESEDSTSNSIKVDRK